MKQVVTLAIVIGLLFTSNGFASDVSFKKAKFLTVKDKKQKELDVELRITDTKFVLLDRKTSQPEAEIPYESVKNMSYELANRHRVAEGAVLMVASLGAGAVLMMTKTKSHWLAVEYRNGDADKLAVIRMHKDEYGDIIAAIESKTGKKVEVLSEGSGKIDPTAESKDLDEVVNYSATAVIAALKPAMEGYGCKVAAEKENRIECQRPRNNGGQEIQGFGGEKVKAVIEKQGERTRVKIETDKGFYGKLRKKNWSTPVFKAMMKNLEQAGRSEEKK
jgi:hypothetical protein